MNTNLREFTATIISVAIALLALWMLADTYFTAGQNPGLAEVFGRKKDVLSTGLGLLGVVLGYYFGRVPAEKQADAARGEAAAARQEAGAAKDNTTRIKSVVSGEVEKLDGLSSAGGGGISPDELKAITRRLRTGLI